MALSTITTGCNSAKYAESYMEEIPKFYIYKGVIKMENEEIMMNEETSTKELVPVEDNAIVDTESTVEDESSEGGSAAGAVALVGVGVMAVVGTVHVVKTYVAPAVAKGVNTLKAKFSKNKVVEGEATEATEDEAEDTVTE